MSRNRKIHVDGHIVEIDDNEQQTERNVNRNDYSQIPSLQRLEFPKVKGGNSIVVIHTTNDQYGINYSIEWDCQKKSQRWSCYQMHSGNSGGKNSRVVDGYLFDEDLPNHNVNYVTNEYGETFDPFWSSGYSHGHICPNADRKYSREGNRQTFFLTNMQPQKNSFNAGLWASLESKVRDWSRSSDTLYVVTGCVLDGAKYYALDRASNKITAPAAYYKAVLRYAPSSSTGLGHAGYMGCAVWMEHKETASSAKMDKTYSMSIDALEQKLGIDLFVNLPDKVGKSVADQIEAEDPQKISWWW
jgi:endonuclease G